MKANFHNIVLICICLFTGFFAFGQIDAEANTLEPAEVRSFDSDKLEEYYSNPEYSYGKRFRLEQKRQELDDAFWANVRRFFSKNRVGDASLFEIILAIVVVFSVFFVALSLLGVDVRKIFKKRSQEIGIPQEELTEDLRELDFDQLLTQSRKQGDYRRGVRLLYLETLKMLSEKNIIRYAKYKTNYEYLLSMRKHPLFADFETLTLQFDYVWYGNFEIDEAGFDTMTKTFRHFQSNLTSKTRTATAK